MEQPPPNVERLSTDLESPNSAKGMALAIIFLTTILGCFGGYIWYEVVTYRLPSGNWSRLYLDQDKAVRIVGADLGHQTVYFESSRGGVYSCQSTGCSPAVSNNVPSDSTQPYSGRVYPAPQPPGEVRDSLVLPLSGLCSGQQNFVVLNDGSAWGWEKIACCEMGCMNMFEYPLGGLGLGLVTGIVIFAIWAVAHRKGAPH